MVDWLVRTQDCICTEHLIDNNNWLGRAQFNDQLFRGSYDEFRIYDIPLTADVIWLTTRRGRMLLALICRAQHVGG